MTIDSAYAKAASIASFSFRGAVTGGHDVDAAKSVTGSIRMLDEVKAYKPGHVLTANDVTSPRFE